MLVMNKHNFLGEKSSGTDWAGVKINHFLWKERAHDSHSIKMIAFCRSEHSSVHHGFA